MWTLLQMQLHVRFDFQRSRSSPSFWVEVQPHMLDGSSGKFVGDLEGGRGGDIACKCHLHMRIWQWTMFHNVPQCLKHLHVTMTTATMTMIRTMSHNDNDNNDNISQWQSQQWQHFTMTMLQTWQQFNNMSQCHTTITPKYYTMIHNVS